MAEKFSPEVVEIIEDEIIRCGFPEVLKQAEEYASEYGPYGSDSWEGFRVGYLYHFFLEKIDIEL